MLGLTRYVPTKRRAEDLVVFFLPDGRRINVHLTHAYDGKARLAIDAPADVKILRGELFEPPQKDKVTA